jgi:hypothetical protein
MADNKEPELFEFMGYKFDFSMEGLKRAKERGEGQTYTIHFSTDADYEEAVKSSHNMSVEDPEGFAAVKAVLEMQGHTVEDHKGNTDISPEAAEYLEWEARMIQAGHSGFDLVDLDELWENGEPVDTPTSEGSQKEGVDKPNTRVGSELIITAAALPKDGKKTK